MESKSLAIKDGDVAADVEHALRSSFDILGESLRRVKQSCSEGEATVYSQKIGDIFYIIVFDLLEPLYEEHPQLKPADWDNDPQTYKNTSG
jgi:hypothetical protein